MLKEPGADTLLAQLFDNQPDSVVVFAPVLGADPDNSVKDFEVYYCNQTAAKLLGTNSAEITGAHLLSTSLIDQATIKLIFSQCLEVWRTGETIDYVYYSPGFDRYFDVQRSKVEKCILSVTRDRTKEITSQQENRHQSEFLNRLIDNAPYGLLLLQPIKDDTGNIIDFKSRMCNQKSTELTGLTKADFEIKTMKELSQARGNHSLLAESLTVVESGEPRQGEYYSHYLKIWLSYNIARFEEGVLISFFDISRRKILEEESRQQTFVLDEIINASLNAIFMCEAVRDSEGAITDLQFLQVNEMYQAIIGKPAAEVIGKTMLELFPGLKRTIAFDAYCKVIETGQPARFEFKYEGDGINGWFDISSVKVGSQGVVVTFADITDRKKAELEKEQQNDLIQTMLNAAFHGKALLEPVRDKAGNVIDFTVIAANNSTEAQIGIKPEVAVGRRISTLLPAYNKNGAFDIYTAVLTSGKSARAEHFYHDDRFQAWFDVYVAPVKTGIVVSFANITERKQELLQIEEQKNLLDAIMTHSPSGISVTEIIRDENEKIVDGRTMVANEAAIQFVGTQKDLYLTKTAKELDPNILESPIYQMTIDTLETGKPFHAQYFFEPTQKWLEMSVAKMDDKRLINVFSDITTTKQVELQVQDLAAKLKTVINTSQAGFFLGKPVFDEGNDIVDFEFTMVNQVLASFVDKQPEELIGQLGSTWFVQYKANGLFDKFCETYVSGRRQQFDVHYEGETVEVWANVMTDKLGDELLGSFTDFTPIKQLQLQLEKSVEELKRSNANLEEFAYAASHDLQEPLRKINFFSEQLRRDLQVQLNDDHIKKFDRMQNASRRMSNLINDLLNYSKVSTKPDVYEQVELTDVVEQVLQDLEATIIDTKAVINVQKLPQIKGDERQLTQVFQNLIGNALKYRKSNSTPQITVASRDVSETALAGLREVKKGLYYLIEISDNGIGFEQSHAEKIFNVFQRLHGRAEYEGTGVGLAIVKKVIQNHQAYIFAESEPGKGAKFTILFPK